MESRSSRCRYGLREGEETQVEIEQGKTLFIKLVALSAADEEGQRTVFFELNGHPREVTVLDRSLAVEQTRRIKADPDNLHHLGSPMAGMVVEVHAKPGQQVAEHDELIVLEAMKRAPSRKATSARGGALRWTAFVTETGVRGR